MSKRNDWVFEIGSDKLANAAAAKVEFHQGRLKFWTEGRDKTMADVKEKGLVITESLAGHGYSASNTTHYGAEITVDDSFQRKLTEAHQKIREHTAKVAEYQGWVQVLRDNAGRTYPLNADDYLYFFGK